MLHCYFVGFPFLPQLLTDCIDDLLFVFCYRQNDNLGW